MYIKRKIATLILILSKKGFVFQSLLFKKRSFYNVSHQLTFQIRYISFNNNKTLRLNFFLYLNNGKSSIAQKKKVFQGQVVEFILKLKLIHHFLTLIFFCCFSSDSSILYLFVITNPVIYHAIMTSQYQQIVIFYIFVMP